MAVACRLKKGLESFALRVKPSIVFGRASAYLKGVMAMLMLFGPKV